MAQPGGRIDDQGEQVGAPRVRIAEDLRPAGGGRRLVFVP
jgi:hypothetical protein